MGTSKEEGVKDTTVRENRKFLKIYYSTFNKKSCDIRKTTYRPKGRTQ